MTLDQRPLLRALNEALRKEVERLKKLLAEARREIARLQEAKTKSELDDLFEDDDTPPPPLRKRATVAKLADRKKGGHK